MNKGCGADGDSDATDESKPLMNAQMQLLLGRNVKPPHQLIRVRIIGVLGAVMANEW